MTREAYIIGSGGHAHVIASFLDRPSKFVVAQPSNSSEISRDAFFSKAWEPDEIDVFIGVGDNTNRRAEFDRIHALNLKVSTCVAPNAWVARGAVLGEGCVICAGAI